MPLDEVRIHCAGSTQRGVVQEKGLQMKSHQQELGAFGKSIAFICRPVMVGRKKEAEYICHFQAGRSAKCVRSPAADNILDFPPARLLRLQPVRKASSTRRARMTFAVRNRQRISRGRQIITGVQTAHHR